MSFFLQMRDALFNNGFPYNGEINSVIGTYHSFNSENGTCKKKCCRYRLFENDLGAHFICWRRGVDYFWFVKDSKSFTSIEKRQIAIERKKHLDLLTTEKRLFQDRAIISAEKLLNYSREASWDHPYIRKKKIIPYYARQIRSYLILPITDINRNLQSLQYIKSNDFKQFKKSASPKEGMLFLAEDIGKDDIIRIVEGYATGCSIYEATSTPVVIAFSASNLSHVAIALRIKYPGNEIHICCDNDQFSKENIGYIEAIKAAKAIGAKVIKPNFNHLDLTNKPTDFNDLFVLAGIEEIEQQLSVSSKFV